MKFSSFLSTMLLAGSSFVLATEHLAADEALRGSFDGFYAGAFGGVAGARFEGIIDGIGFKGFREIFSNEWMNNGIFGGYAGYNIVRNNFLFGIEGDLGFGDISEVAVQSFEGHDIASHSIDYVATARARVGAIVGEQSLIYGTGGLAYIPSEFKIRDDIYTAPQSGTKNFRNIGYAVGLGVEQMMSDRFNLRIEGLYIGGMPKHTFFEDELVSGVDNNDFVQVRDFFQIRAGTTFRF